MTWRFLALLMLLATLSGCQHQRLIIETRYISPADLASTFVGTPDPRQYCPTTGQELTLTWRLPEFDYEDNLYLLLTVRFKDREMDECVIPICRFRGAYTYSLLDDDYWSHCGIVTYKVELFAGDCLLDCWHHQLWNEVICFDAYEEEEAFLDGPPWQL